jgi:hypothetical protein
MKGYCTVQDIKAGQDMLLYGIVSIGIAARDIPAGSIIDYNPERNTLDVIVTEDVIITAKKNKNANSP